MKIDAQQIILVDPNLLTLHPVAKDLPELEHDSPDFRTLVEDLRSNGQRYPIDIDRTNRILDGRHRWRGCKELKIPSMSAIVRSDAEAVSIILESLLLRRHYTKGALAYSAYPMLRAAYEEARQNRGVHSVHDPFTVEAQAEKFGISKRLYHQARELHDIFDKDQTYKELMLADVMSGECGLGAAVAGYAGYKSTKGKPKPKVNALKLFSQTFVDLSVRYQYWNKFSQEEKREAGLAISKAVEAMPIDLVTNLKRRLADEPKRRAQEAK